MGSLGEAAELWNIGCPVGSRRRCYLKPKWWVDLVPLESWIYGCLHMEFFIILQPSVTSESYIDPVNQSKILKEGSWPPRLWFQDHIHLDQKLDTQVTQMPETASEQPPLCFFLEILPKPWACQTPASRHSAFLNWFGSLCELPHPQKSRGLRGMLALAPCLILLRSHSQSSE